MRRKERQNRIMISPDKSGPIRKGEEIDLGRLNEYIKRKHLSIGPVINAEQFPGGYSNLTYLLQAEKAEIILRRPPFGAAIKSAHDMGREFKVLSLLKSHYSKVPTPVLYCDDLNVMGAPFYLMERTPGVILRPSRIRDINIVPAVMQEIAESAIDNLAVIHSLDIHTTGLLALGKSEGYIQRQVNGWTKRFEDAKTDPVPDMDSIGDWLNKNQPAESSPVFIHNDYKYDNLVLKEDNLPEIVAVLDWEMATVGDRWMDLGASLAYWAEAGDDELAKTFNVSWLPGNLTRKEVFYRYCVKSGQSNDNMVFYYTFGLYKNAVIAQQIYKRWRLGHTNDPRFEKLIHVIRSLASRGIKSVATGMI